MKQKSDGYPIDLSCMMITATLPDYFYIESSDRSSGVRVDKEGHGHQAGIWVDITGTVSTTPDGEKCIDATKTEESISDNTPNIYPLFTVGRSLGGSKLWQQDGVCSVKITEQPDSSLTKILEPATEGEVNAGVRVEASGLSYDSGDFLTITGISSCFKDADDGKLRRLLRVVSIE